LIDRAVLEAPGLSAEARERRALGLTLAEAALAAVEPRAATAAAIRRLTGRGVRTTGVTVFAFGKAAVPMTRGALDAASVRGGVVIAPSLELATHDLERRGLQVRAGGHPLPAADALETGDRVLALARSLGPDDVALCLISGGGSAMLERPRDGVTLETLQRVTRALLAAGADITALNKVRRALSATKGGRLAAAIAPARVVNVILSDVPGAPLEVVASGPTLPPPDGDAAAVLRRHLGPEGAALALPPPAPPRLPPIETELAADHETARRAVREVARARGLSLTERSGVFGGEARALGAALAAEPPGAWVWSGETTVTVRGDGRGGRNQELALAALEAGWRDGLLLALATDGVDGASDHAGAIADAAAARGLRPGEARRALDRNDSAPLLARLGAALRTGPTGTNVADLLIRLA